MTRENTRRGVFREALDAIQELIQEGPLREPEHSERNGMILAYNEVFSLMLDAACDLGCEQCSCVTHASIPCDQSTDDHGLRILIHKPRSVGCSSVFPGDSEVKRSHLLLYLPEFQVGALGKFYSAMLVGEVAPVHYVKGAAGPSEISSHVGIVHESLANVVNLPSDILAIRVGQKGDVFGWKDAWRQVVQFARAVPPDGMEFCLDKNVWMHPDRPAVQLFAAVCGDVLWNDAETFKRWLAVEWLRNNESRQM